MNFQFLAVDRQGLIHRGLRPARDLPDLEKALSIDGLALLRAHPARAWRSAFRLDRRELMQFCFEIELLFRSGIPLLDGLTDLQANAGSQRHKRLLDELKRHISQGEVLSVAMTRFPKAFPALVCRLVAAGEVSGQLTRTLGMIGEHLKWQDELFAQTGKALIYPGIVLLVVGSVSLFLLVVLVPQLRQFALQMHAVPTTASRLLFAASDFLRTDWPYIPVALAGGGVCTLLAWRFTHLSQLLDRLLWQLPGPGRLLRALAISRFASTLGLLYDAGLPLLDSLEITRTVAHNPTLRRGLKSAEQSIQSGNTLAQALARTAIFPPLMLRLLQIGEQSGRLGEALGEIARLNLRDARDGIARLQTLIEPALTLLLGLFLGWLMMAVLGPIYDIIGRLKP